MAHPFPFDSANTRPVRTGTEGLSWFIAVITISVRRQRSPSLSLSLSLDTDGGNYSANQPYESRPSFLTATFSLTTSPRVICQAKLASLLPVCRCRCRINAVRGWRTESSNEFRIFMGWNKIISEEKFFFFEVDDVLLEETFESWTISAFGQISNRSTSNLPGGICTFASRELLIINENLSVG